MKSWENLLGIWHFRALPPVNSGERCQLCQCLNLSGGHVLFKQGRKECTSIGPVTAPVCQLQAQGQQQLLCTWISDNPAHSSQCAPGFEGAQWEGDEGVNLRCHRFYTSLCCGFWNEQIGNEIYTWALEVVWNSTECTKFPKCTGSYYLASSCHRFVIQKLKPLLSRH